jgi:hypothetical protein
MDNPVPVLFGESRNLWPLIGNATRPAPRTWNLKFKVFLVFGA